jgi:hypothetical protein
MSAVGGTGLRDRGPAGRYPPFRRVATPVGGGISACPACGSTRIHAVAYQGPKYFCGACSRCWVLELGGVLRVNPVPCPGCGHRDDCFEALREDIPAWMWLPAE